MVLLRKVCSLCEGHDSFCSSRVLLVLGSLVVESHDLVLAIDRWHLLEIHVGLHDGGYVPGIYVLLLVLENLLSSVLEHIYSFS